MLYVEYMHKSWYAKDQDYGWPTQGQKYVGYLGILPGQVVGLLRKNFFSKNFEALHRDSAKRYGDSADEIFAGVEACNTLICVSSEIPRQLQFLGRREER